MLIKHLFYKYPHNLRGVSWNTIASRNFGKQVVGNDRGHVKTIIKMLAANNADYSPAPVALAA